MGKRHRALGTMLSLFGLLCLLLVPASVFACNAPVHYIVTELGMSQAYGVNNAGQVVGSYQNHAALWEHGKLLDLGTLKGGTSCAYGINNCGQVVGESDGRAFLWQRGRMTDLGTLGGHYSRAFAINDDGQVVGESATTKQTPAYGFNNLIGRLQSAGQAGWQAFSWEKGRMTGLSGLGGQCGCAYGINEDGLIIGTSTDASNLNVCGVLWRRGKPTMIPYTNAYEQSIVVPMGINDAGDVVGTVCLPNGPGYPHLAFQWKAGKTLTEITSNGADSWGAAMGINNHGEVVGALETLERGFEPSAWENGQVCYLQSYCDLDDTYAVFGTATAINDRGDILVNDWGFGSPPLLLTPSK